MRNSEEELQGDVCSPTYYRYYHRENRNYPFEAETLTRSKSKNDNWSQLLLLLFVQSRFDRYAHEVWCGVTEKRRKKHFHNIVYTSSLMEGG
jgi:hypothetical protein